MSRIENVGFLVEWKLTGTAVKMLRGLERLMRISLVSAERSVTFSMLVTTISALIALAVLAAARAVVRMLASLNCMVAVEAEVRVVRLKSVCVCRS